MKEGRRVERDCGGGLRLLLQREVQVDAERWRILVHPQSANVSDWSIFCAEAASVSWGATHRALLQLVLQLLPLFHVGRALPLRLLRLRMHPAELLARPGQQVLVAAGQETQEEVSSYYCGYRYWPIYAGTMDASRMCTRTSACHCKVACGPAHTSRSSDATHSAAQSCTRWLCRPTWHRSPEALRPGP